MDKISSAEVMEGYKKIKEYCKQFSNCGECIFLQKDSVKSFHRDEPCIFGVGFHPCDWN